VRYRRGASKGEAEAGARPNEGVAAGGGGGGGGAATLELRSQLDAAVEENQVCYV